MKLRSAALCSLLLVSVALTGCSSPESLVSGGMTMCVSEDTDSIVGYARLENTGASEITLDSVSFGELDNVEVDDVWAAPDAQRGEEWIDGGTTAPQSRDDPFWADAVEVSGAPVPPGGTTIVFFTVTRVDPSQTGLQHDVVVEYREGTGFTSRAGQHTANMSFGFGEGCSA